MVRPLYDCADGPAKALLEGVSALHQQPGWMYGLVCSGGYITAKFDSLFASIVTIRNFDGCWLESAQPACLFPTLRSGSTALFLSGRVESSMLCRLIDGYTRQMTTLLSGLILWAIVHWFPLALPAQRATLATRLGEAPYKGIFSLLSLAGIALIIVGWRQAPLIKVYVPPFFGNWFIAVAIAVAFILFFAPYVPNNFRRLIRHPQLTGVGLWGAAHLLVNGTVRDLLLFGGLATWAVVSMLFANRRDGEWRQPAPAPLWRDISLIALGVAAAAGVFHFHSKLFGVTPIH